MAQRAKSTVFVITGNGLEDGRVVYLRGDGSWGPDLDAASQLTDAAERDRTVATAAVELRTRITGIYAFEVGITEGGERILSAREQLRAQGESATRRRMGFGG